MFNNKGVSNRRRFLGHVASGAAALGVATLANPVRLAAGALKPSPVADDSSIESWLGKVKGKHRQVFDSMMADSGLPLAWARVFLETNKGVGVAESDLTAVIILRHEAIPLALENRLWTKYKFDDMFKVTNMMTKKVLTQNVFWKPKPGDLPLPGMALNELLDSGVLIGVCDMAMTVYSMQAAGAMKMTPEECKKDWVSGVLPGIQIVPSGVMAVSRAQQHGCTYCWAG